MSAQSHTETDLASVTTMQSFLREFLAEATHADALLHDVIRRTRERIYALELAEDPSFVQEHEKFSAAVRDGHHLGADGLTAKGFAERYLSA